MADEETKPKRKAKDNPWYRLATLHGEPSKSDDEIAQKNRVAWNRWMAAGISDDLKTAWRWKGWSDDELTPFSEDELRRVEAQVGSPLEADRIDFSNTEFEALFAPRGFIFPHDINFDNATFSGGADFGNATFSGSATFVNAAFSGSATFVSATFSGLATFLGATFSGGVDFGDATFSGSATFDSATFNGIASFVNAEMKNVTIFTNVRFGRPPGFFGAKLHEGPTWRHVTWPAPPENREQAGEYVEAYERLKLEMVKLNKHGDELDFFARELQCRRVLLGFWRGLPIWLYGVLCGHGRYYMRPLATLVVIVILGAVPIRAHFGGGWSLATFTEHSFGGGAIGLSSANTFGILGIRKDLADPGILQSLPGWLKAAAAIQTICGLVLLFLFGLSLRNRFRMK